VILCFRAETLFQTKPNEKIIGIVLYGGDEILPFGDEDYERYALPLGVFF